jgi:SAM-dependent methyltransferase
VTAHSPRAVRASFEKPFFDRYYARRTSAVTSASEVFRCARFVCSYLAHLQLDVGSVLDAGCGTGLWRRALRRIDRNIAYTGFDPSDYLCRRYGWTQSTIADFKSRRKFDLVVCQDVLQYLGEREVRRSIRSLSRVCRGALYLYVPTSDDIAEGLLDTGRTDGAIHVRSASWYRKLLRKDFANAGGGVFIARSAGTVVLALERLEA